MISISIAGCRSSTSSTHQLRYAVWLQLGQSKLMWATTRGGWPSPGRPYDVDLEVLVERLALEKRCLECVAERADRVGEHMVEHRR
jgi:hypothetical protein